MANGQRWTHRPEILSYVIDSYAGVEKTDSTGLPRRVFIWEDGTEIKMGNTEAFMCHLAERFELIKTNGSVPALHQLLRDLGEQIATHAAHTRSSEGPRAGRFKPSEPDEWVIGVVKTDTPTEPK